MKTYMAGLLLVLAAASPSMAADLKGDLIAMEKSGWKAWYNHDAKAYSDLMTEDAVQAAAGAVTTGREKILAVLGSDTCKLKSFEFADTNVRQPSPDIAIVTYTATQDVTCDGKKSPAKVFATAIYARNDGKWRWTNYQETVLE